MTFFNTGAGKDGYFLHFETDDKEKYLYMQKQARKCIDNAYTTDVVPVVHAHWETVRTRKKRCSNCHAPKPYRKDKRGYCLVWDSKRCPNCGAKMDEEV